MYGTSEKVTGVAYTREKRIKNIISQGNQKKVTEKLLAVTSKARMANLHVFYRLLK